MSYFLITGFTYTSFEKNAKYWLSYEKEWIDLGKKHGLVISIRKPKQDSIIVNILFKDEVIDYLKLDSFFSELKNIEARELFNNCQKTAYLERTNQLH